MNDLIVITAHCPTELQEKMVEDSIDSVIGLGYHVLLISHTHIPIHIQKKCQYYFYDYLNETSNDYTLFPIQSFATQDFIIQSRFLQKSFYGFAIYRMFSIASQVAINFGYDNIHHIEYDCELLDKTIIDEHSSLLENYKSILYTDDGTSDGFLFGSLKSFRVNSLPEFFKTYNKDFIEDKMRNTEPKHLEYLTKKLFIDSGDVLFRNSDDLTKHRFQKGPKFFNRGLHYTLYYNPKNNMINIFYLSMKQCVENIVIMVNYGKIIRFQAVPNQWQIQPLGLLEDINHVRVDNSEKCLYEKSFDDEFKKVFINDSYITFYEENN